MVVADLFVTELNTFVQKFQQLWSAGITAHLDLDTHAGQAWVGLRAPGHLHHLHPFPQAFKKQDSPSRQRRRARREAARKTKAEKVPTSNENAEEANLVEETDKCENDRSECSDHLDQNEKTLTDAAEEASDKDMNVADELCPDEEFDNAIPTEEPKSICTVEIFPMNYKLDGLQEFRATVEDYFENRKDVIKRVLKCEVVNHGNNVKLVVEMKQERGWIFFFDPEKNYKDLEGFRTLRHSCQDLSNCDRL